MTMLLPLLAFLFGSLLIAAGAMAFVAGAPRRRSSAASARSTGARVKPRPRRTPATTRRVIDTLKKIGNVAPQSPNGDGQAAAAAGDGRLPQPRSARRSSSASASAARCSAVRAAGVADRHASRTWRSPAAACALGYLLPSMALGRMAKKRQHRIRLGLPDALDLLVVSVEAGLGLDQAIQRVGDELAFAHPDLADELRLINLELRAGKARAEALSNLGRPHRRRRHRVARRDAGADRQVRHQRGAVAARALRDACAPSGASAPRKPPPRPA